MTSHSMRYPVAAALCLLLPACSKPVAGPQPTPDGPAAERCSAPQPAEVLARTIVVDLPSDSDSTTNPTPTSTIHYNLLLPERCPGDAFPIVLHSHGYSGTRLGSLAADGALEPIRQLPHFPAMDALARALPFHGYAVISVDQRGHGDSAETTNARIIDPALETQDLRAILDWAHDNADSFGFLRQPGSGIARDLVVGTLGVSYGGGFQMPLAALDARIDAIVPNGTWNNLLYSLLPGDAVKLSFDGLLCTLAGISGTVNTPLVAALCNQVGPTSLVASSRRTRDDLVGALDSPLSQPRQVAEAEVDPFFFTHSMRYFERQQAAGAPWGFGEPQARLRPVPALFVQGNRDVLFNLTEAAWNADYFRAAGGTVKLISTEGGHMNPLAGQVEGTADCGSLRGVDAVLAWFDHWLRREPAAAALVAAQPAVCLSVADTVDGEPGGAPAGLALDAVPVGSPPGDGVLPAVLATATAEVGDVLATPPVFVPVVTVPDAGWVLAGVPTLGRIDVQRRGSVLDRAAIAFVGVGIRRGDTLRLVDDQVTPFVEGVHTDNRNQGNGVIALPGVGERLEAGDEVGLLFFEQQVQYAAILSAQSLPTLTNVINFALGAAIPPIASALDPGLLAAPNPHSVGVEDIRLPILKPGVFPGSRLLVDAAAPGG